MANEKRREPARWVFSRELRDTTLTHVDDEYDVKREYFITKAGSVGRRVLFCGKITQKNEENETIKLTVADPTGAFYVTFFSKDFNQDTRAELDLVSENQNVMVVGRTSFFTSNEGKFYVNINPETVREVREEDLEYWKIQAIAYLKRRLSIMHELSKSPELNEEQIVSLGFTQDEAEGCIMANSAYSTPDLGSLEDLLISMNSYHVSEDAINLKDEVFQIIKESAAFGGITYQEILDTISKKGKDSQQLDEALNLLGAEGEVYEAEKRKFRPA